ncbi:MAG TPA: DUF805 domain-containing protein [Rhizomicrobium sp.]|nr:DUF805 domain-containing protein [Rhizomicrobium sp.]
MSYLFGFKGRINRAKIWLFLLIVIVWEIVVGLVAVFGLKWTHYLSALEAHARAGSPFAPAPMPVPDPVSGTAWIAAGAIAFLIVLYVVAWFAVYTKRLHDRNKSAWWLVPYVLVPMALSAFVIATGTWPYFYVGFWVGPMGMARALAYLAGSLIGLWVLVELWFFRGTKGENRYGPDPLA